MGKQYFFGALRPIYLLVVLIIVCTNAINAGVYPSNSPFKVRFFANECAGVGGDCYFSVQSAATIPTYTSGSSMFMHNIIGRPPGCTSEACFDLFYSDSGVRGMVSYKKGNTAGFAFCDLSYYVVFSECFVNMQLYFCSSHIDDCPAAFKLTPSEIIRQGYFNPY
jgi:hypothetical protein